MKQRRESSTTRFAFRFKNGRTDTAGKERDRRDQETASPLPEEGAPQIAKLLALAHHMEDQLRSGAVPSHAAVAQQMRITRARTSQLGVLLLLGPDIQEELLECEEGTQGPHLISERMARLIAAEPNWKRQRTKWNQAKRAS